MLIVHSTLETAPVLAIGHHLATVPPLSTTAQAIDGATAPARWLLESGVEGIALTQTHALARAVVREAAERWPGWWNAELFGEPHRETDLAVLQELHDGLRRLRLLRRRGPRLHATVRGRELSQDPAVLLAVLATDLGRGDDFTEVVAGEVIDMLADEEHRSHDDLAATALGRVSRDGWRGPDGRPPTERDVSWVVSDVLRRGEAYGLIERHPGPEKVRFLRSRISLSDAGRIVLGVDRRQSVGTSVLVFDAQLLNARGVGATLAVGVDQHLTALHDAIQQVFGWYDDHLYSFWLDGVFWGDEQTEYTSPVMPDEGGATADVPLAELDLAVGAKIAYVFDFGDDWRVQLTLSEHTQPDDGTYPRVLERRGSAPPQYPPLDED